MLVELFDMVILMNPIKQLIEYLVLIVVIVQKKKILNKKLYLPGILEEEENNDKTYLPQLQ